MQVRIVVVAPPAAAAAMATSQAVLAQALPAASPVASSSGIAQRKPASANLAGLPGTAFKGSVAGLRWDSNGSVQVSKVGLPPVWVVFRLSVLGSDLCFKHSFGCDFKRSEL